MKTNKSLLVLVVLVFASMALSACGGSPNLYTVQSLQIYGEKLEYYAPQNNLLKSELVLTLPEGGAWTVIVKEPGCKAFQLSEDNLPTAEIGLEQGIEYPAGKKFSLSCPTGKVYWLRATVIPATAPTNK